MGTRRRRRTSDSSSRCRRLRARARRRISSITSCPSWNRHFGAAAVQQGGLVVHTTLDLGLQQSWRPKAVKNGVRDLAYAHINNSRLCWPPIRKQARVLAWVGSADYGNDRIAGQFDVVLYGARGTGGLVLQNHTSMKLPPVRDHKITLATILNDTPTDFNGCRPKDFACEQWGA